jgi:hypothetical protein
MRKLIAGLATMAVALVAITSGASAAPGLHAQDVARGTRPQMEHANYHHNHHYYDHRRWEHHHWYYY